MDRLNTLEADYLVIGAGAMGMAFVDTLLAESNASVFIVDRHHAPGGHWNDAYPFVRLHSASANYGVNSRPLGEDTIDPTGLNRGFYEQASAAELCSYFDRIMRAQFLPSGRVRYFPMCDYRGDGRFVSLTSGAKYAVTVKKKIVDATFTDTEVPAKRPPKYAVASGMQVVPPNALPTIDYSAQRFMVIGAGKTGIDACLWLLEHDVPTELITWIVPRDSWLVDREHVQPKPEFFARRMAPLALQVELIQQAESPEQLLQLLDQHDQLLRIDQQVTPTRYRCATVSRAELQALRRISNVVRLGHVRSIDSDRIVLDNGTIATHSDVIHVDCTSSGIRTRRPATVFDDRTITLQAIRTCQLCFSAALIAHLEVTYQTDVEKNAFSRPIPLPIRDVDWLSMYLANLSNQSQWSRTSEIRNWIAKSRLDFNYGQPESLTPEESVIVQRFRNGAGPAAAKLMTLLKDIAN